MGPLVRFPQPSGARFACLHDADHTSRSKGALEKVLKHKLEAMKRDDPRWKRDGIADLRSAMPSFRQRKTA